MKEKQKFYTKEDAARHEKRHHFSPEKSFDYDQITERIYLGTNMCCEVGYSKELLKKKIFGDISLEKERVDNPFGVDYFLWLPVEDDYAPTQKQLRLGVQTIELFVCEKIKLYAHCKNGHGRAPTLVAAYFIKSGMSVDEALKFVKAKRPSIHPNKIQISALKEYKNYL